MKSRCSHRRPHRASLDGPFPLEQGQASTRVRDIEKLLRHAGAEVGPGEYEAFKSKDLCLKSTRCGAFIDGCARTAMPPAYGPSLSQVIASGIAWSVPASVVRGRGCGRPGKVGGDAEAAIRSARGFQLQTNDTEGERKVCEGVTARQVSPVSPRHDGEHEAVRETEGKTLIVPCTQQDIKGRGVEHMIASGDVSLAPYATTGDGGQNCTRTAESIETNLQSRASPSYARLRKSHTGAMSRMRCACVQRTRPRLPPKLAKDAAQGLPPGAWDWEAVSRTLNTFTTQDGGTYKNRRAMRFVKSFDVKHRQKSERRTVENVMLGVGGRSEIPTAWQCTVMESIPENRVCDELRETIPRNASDAGLLSDRSPSDKTSRRGRRSSSCLHIREKDLVDHVLANAAANKARAVGLRQKQWDIRSAMLPLLRNQAARTQARHDP
jgi:hypothetical protein